jgi:hypothetical protein
MLNNLVISITKYIGSILLVIGLYVTYILESVKNDSPEPWAIGFQDGVSPGYTGIVELHDNIFFYLVVIAILVFWMLGSTIYYFNYDRTKITYKYLVHGTLIEILWTIFPAIVLLAIAIPSFRLLYILDEVTLPTITVKVTGLLVLKRDKDGPKSYNLIYPKLPAFGFLRRGSAKKFFSSIHYGPWLHFSALFSPKKIHSLNNTLIPSPVLGLHLKKDFHSRCRAINRIGPHNIDIISTLWGLLLGDGYANNRSGEGVRIVIKQSEIHKEYLFFLYNFFLDREYCSNLEPRKYFRKIKGRDKIYYGFEFNTFTFRSFLWIYKSFYKNGKKILPLNLDKYLNELVLSILIMDDGGWTGEGVRISTYCFTFAELERLILLLKIKFDLDCTIQKIQLKDKYSVYIKKNSIDKLRKLTLPYIHKSMLYKLGFKDEKN